MFVLIIFYGWLNEERFGSRSFIHFSICGQHVLIPFAIVCSVRGVRSIGSDLLLQGLELEYDSTFHLPTVSAVSTMLVPVI